MWLLLKYAHIHGRLTSVSIRYISSECSDSSFHPSIQTAVVFGQTVARSKYWRWNGAFALICQSAKLPIPCKRQAISLVNTRWSSSITSQQPMHPRRRLCCLIVSPSGQGNFDCWKLVSQNFCCSVRCYQLDSNLALLLFAVTVFLLPSQFPKLLLQCLLKVVSIRMKWLCH